MSQGRKNGFRSGVTFRLLKKRRSLIATYTGGKSNVKMGYIYIFVVHYICQQLQPSYSKYFVSGAAGGGKCLVCLCVIRY